MLIQSNLFEKLVQHHKIQEKDLLKRSQNEASSIRSALVIYQICSAKYENPL